MKKSIFLGGSRSFFVTKKKKLLTFFSFCSFSKGKKRAFLFYYCKKPKKGGVSIKGEKSKGRGLFRIFF